MSIYVDVKKKFKDFSLEVQFETNSDPLGILGASGCGKSLTLKCIAGIETPDEGLIKVNGKTVFDSSAGINVKPRFRNVGYLFQSYALFPNMTVKENIMAAMSKDNSQIEEKIQTLVDRYKISGLEDRYPVSLSGGQQQRVALARIFAYEPELLLLDEPFSALDTYLRENMEEELLEVIHEYSGDVVMVTHNRDEAYHICNRILVLDSGKILGDSDPQGLFKNPGYLEVAKVTGCKNISDIEKIDDTTIFAKDWGVTLKVNGPVENHSHIGIRAHYFTKTGSSDFNKINVEIIKEMKGPFEKDVIMKNPQMEDGRKLWWICDKDLKTEDIDHIYISKDDIFLLKSSNH